MDGWNSAETASLFILCVMSWFTTGTRIIIKYLQLMTIKPQNNCKISAQIASSTRHDLNIRRLRLPAHMDLLKAALEVVDVLWGLENSLDSHLLTA